MPTLNQNLSKIAKNLLKTESKYEREILRNYITARKDIKAEIGRIYEKYASKGKLTYAEMTRYNRLTGLENEINSVMLNTYNVNARTTEKLTKGVYEASFFEHGWAIDQGAGVGLKWGLFNPATIAAAVDNPLRYLALDGIKRNGLIGIKRTITQGLIQGLSYTDMAKGITKFFDTDARKFMTIARTEGQRAQVLGQMDAYENAEDQGVQLTYIWDATLDQATRPEHGALDGQAAEMIDGQPMWNTSYGMVSGPLQSGIPEMDINCFPGWVNVTSHTGVEKIYKRYYTGELITILTGNGILLTGTPNHPILTDHGWMPLHELKNGINVICNRLTKKAAIRKADIQYKPTMFSEIFDLGLIRRSINRVFSGNKQFHGDGGDGNIDIINMNGFLPNALKFIFGKPFQKLFFSKATSVFSNFKGLRSLYFFIYGMLAASHGIMCRLYKGIALFWSRVFHPIIHSLATIPLDNTAFIKNADDNLTADTILDRKLFDRNTFEMFTDKIVSINRSNFSGHVYNLQCNDDIYGVNILSDIDNRQGIITHNCRCRVRAEIEGYEPEVRRIRDEGVVEYKTFEQWATPKGWTPEKGWPKK